MLRIALLLTCLLAPAAALAQTAAPAAGPAVATFAGGCFWCIEADFDKIEGVTGTVSGYTGGREPNPTYRQVSAGATSHIEAVEIRFDPAKVGYRELLEVYWRNIDPLAKDRQFCDSGRQYRSAIFYHGEEQRRLAEASKKAIEAKLKTRVFTEILPAAKFYPAEDYHQDYAAKNPVRYNFYRWNCGRDQRLEQLWGPKK